jgi:two-component system OmpR family sensor kinase
MSIRLRLTLYYVSLLAVILIIFSGALYMILFISSLDEVDRTLQLRATDVQNSITAALVIQADPAVALARGRVRLLPAADVFATPGVYVQLSRLDGTPFPGNSRSENLGDQYLTPTSAMLARVATGESIYANLTPLRLYVAPLKSPRGEIIGFIEVAQSLEGVNSTLRRLATLFIGGITMSIVLAAVGGALLAQNALAPIDRITQTAHGITHSGDLTRRLEQGKTRDEVGRLAETFNEMLGRIEELFRSQQRFVSDVSHELRSPLTAIRGNLDLLRRGASDDPEARHQALTAIDAEAERMQRLVTDLLLLARADEGIKIQKEIVELDTVMLDVYRQARVIAGGVNVCLGSEDQAQVMGDRDRLKQLLLNLVDNAIKYTPSGGEVRLSLERDTQWVRVTVSDTGIGIPTEDLPRIFDRFYRVDKARSREMGGSGLGLAIAKWITDAHGGRIEVQSEVGKGTIFTLWLPLANSG